MGDAGAIFGLLLGTVAVVTVAVSIATGRTYWKPEFVYRRTAPSTFRLAILTYSAIAVGPVFLALTTLLQSGR